MLATAWSEVNPTVIINSWFKTGLSQREEPVVHTPIAQDVGKEIKLNDNNRLFDNESLMVEYITPLKYANELSRSLDSGLLNHTGPCNRRIPMSDVSNIQQTMSNDNPMPKRHEYGKMLSKDLERYISTNNLMDPDVQRSFDSINAKLNGQFASNSLFDETENSFFDFTEF